MTPQILKELEQIRTPIIALLAILILTTLGLMATARKVTQPQINDSVHIACAPPLKGCQITGFTVFPIDFTNTLHSDRRLAARMIYIFFVSGFSVLGLLFISWFNTKLFVDEFRFKTMAYLRTLPKPMAFFFTIKSGLIIAIFTGVVTVANILYFVLTSLYFPNLLVGFNTVSIIKGLVPLFTLAFLMQGLLVFWICLDMREGYFSSHLMPLKNGFLNLLNIVCKLLFLIFPFALRTTDAWIELVFSKTPLLQQLPLIGALVGTSILLLYLALQATVSRRNQVLVFLFLILAMMVDTWLSESQYVFRWIYYSIITLYAIYQVSLQGSFFKTSPVRA